jgi:hypothetical protein
MNDITLDQHEEDFLLYEIRDDALEAAACLGNEKAKIFTQWMCTAVYFCPSP